MREVTMFDLGINHSFELNLFNESVHKTSLNDSFRMSLVRSANH